MRKGTIAMRSIFLSFLLAFVASAPPAAEQPAADPVLAEATGLAGTAMFMTSGARARRPQPRPRLWRDREGQQADARRQQPSPPEFYHQGLHDRGAGLPRRRGQAQSHRPPAAHRPRREGARIRHAPNHAARSCDPFSRPAARDGRRAGRRVFARLADAGGSLEMAPRLQTPLGTRQHRRLFQCRLRSPCRRHRNSGRALPS